MVESESGVLKKKVYMMFMARYCLRDFAVDGNFVREMVKESARVGTG